MANNPITYLLGIAVSCLLISCGGSKKLADRPIPVHTDTEIVDALENHNRDWEWLVAKMGINIDSPQEKAGGTLYLRMKKDSVIWMMVKKLGIEAARVQLTPDSFQIIYRLERVYDEGDLDDFLHHYNLNTTFRDLQEMLVGNVILPDTAGIHVSQSPKGHWIEGSSYDLDMKYMLDPYELRVKETIITDAYDRSAKANFSDYREWDGLEGMIPKKREYVLPINAKDKAYLKLGIKDYDIDKPKNIRFSIPSHYERL